MRVWRALKALGCSVLRDGVYLLPHRPEFRQAFQVQAEEVRACGGNAHVLLLDSEDQEQQSLFEAFSIALVITPSCLKSFGKLLRNWILRI
jgi:hypothetical protein